MLLACALLFLQCAFSVCFAFTFSILLFENCQLGLLILRLLLEYIFALNPDCAVREYLCYKIRTIFLSFSFAISYLPDKDNCLSLFYDQRLIRCLFLKHYFDLILVLSTFPYSDNELIIVEMSVDITYNFCCIWRRTK